jgi:hypothetical protein
LLVGRLTTTASGDSTLAVKSYVRNGPTIDLDPSSIVWDATYNFTETNVMTHLLVWMHGPNVEYDAIRVGTTYGDALFAIANWPTAGMTHSHRRPEHRCSCPNGVMRCQTIAMLVPRVAPCHGEYVVVSIIT